MLFRSVGGGATAEKVTEAFKIMLSNKSVKGILVNIFGGIMRCDTIASGIITAVKQVNLSVPLVVRLEGTNVELGKKILAESGLPIISASNMDDAAQKVVAAAKGKAKTGAKGKTGAPKRAATKKKATARPKAKAQSKSKATKKARGVKKVVGRKRKTVERKRKTVASKRKTVARKRTKRAAK